jgi:hypothetical protein
MLCPGFQPLDTLSSVEFLRDGTTATSLFIIAAALICRQVSSRCASFLRRLIAFSLCVTQDANQSTDSQIKVAIEQRTRQGYQPRDSAEELDSFRIFNPLHSIHSPWMPKHCHSSQHGAVCNKSADAVDLNYDRCLGDDCSCLANGSTRVNPATPILNPDA